MGWQIGSDVLIHLFFLHFLLSFGTLAFTFSFLEDVLMYIEGESDIITTIFRCRLLCNLTSVNDATTFQKQAQVEDFRSIDGEWTIGASHCITAWWWLQCQSWCYSRHKARAQSVCWCRTSSTGVRCKIDSLMLHLAAET
ncbi:hypothetical protein IWX49DRAFT_353063 [Phyllosticta citricarpa]